MFIPAPGSRILDLDCFSSRNPDLEPQIRGKKTLDTGSGSATLFNRLTEFSMKDVESARGIWFKKWKWSQNVDDDNFSLFCLVFISSSIRA
jgi:hypothetical protein